MSLTLLLAIEDKKIGKEISVLIMFSTLIEHSTNLALHIIVGLMAI